MKLENKKTYYILMYIKEDIMADYDRGFVNRKERKTFRFFCLVLIVGLVCYGLNLYCEQFYSITLWEAIQQYLK